VNKSVAVSLIATGFIIPIAVFEPYIAAGVLADSIIFGRYPIQLKHAQILTPEDLSRLTTPALSARQ
jgi:hypothetical protein